MAKQAVIIITDGPNGDTIDIKVDYHPNGANDKIISHQIAAAAVGWISSQLKNPELHRTKH